MNGAVLINRCSDNTSLTILIEVWKFKHISNLEQFQTVTGAALMRAFLGIFIVMAASGAPAAAQTELSFYGGFQTAPHSRVSGNDPGGIGAFDFVAAWEGRSLTLPLYYGVRLTWWQSATLGWGLDFSHDKIYASNATLVGNSLSILEFTDGLNILTFNAYRRWPDRWSIFTPYVGAGVGVSIPHVEFESIPSAGTTFEYQLGGPAVTVIAGASYPLGDRWSVFGEYKATYSINKLDLVSGGTLNTNIVTNTFNLGASLGF